MNIVGTPYSDEQRSPEIACKVASGSKAGAGSTTQAPWLVHDRQPSTIAKQ